MLPGCCPTATALARIGQLVTHQNLWRGKLSGLARYSVRLGLYSYLGVAVLANADRQGSGSLTVGSIPKWCGYDICFWNNPGQNVW